MTEENPTAIDLNELDPALLSVMLAAIDSKPGAADLTTEQKHAICAEAIVTQNLNDPDWLAAQIATYQARNKKFTFQSIEIEPATPITDQTQLAEILSRHKAWQSSVLEPNQAIQGGRAHFNGLRLENLDFTGYDLRGADFRSATLISCNFSAAQLSTCDFRDAHLENCIFHAAKYRNCQLAGAYFKDCDFTDADLRQTPLDEADWEPEAPDLSSEPRLKNPQPSNSEASSL